MDVVEIRRLNLEGLIGEMQTIEAVAATLKSEKNYANYLSQVRGGSRNMGNKIARLLEEKMGKPRGWMDNLQFKTAEDAVDNIEAIQIMQALPEEDRASWLKHGRLLLSNIKEASSSSPFAGVGKAPAKPRKRKPGAGTQ